MHLAPPLFLWLDFDEHLPMPCRSLCTLKTSRTSLCIHLPCVCVLLLLSRLREDSPESTLTEVDLVRNDEAGLE